ncbi:SDR family oxidoreductase [Hoyosella altamirensis]|uniref:2,3-dihydro-2,3-dihydroxybenzoate dehydrogenase n=1 Tax=Hoyosella altamirensis TaxID=616997 RepID=A0A839RN56_9ACTN|nr:SDR family oxidoreductase [Hoyosella altamirensis]MBB3037940.1 2,3-dihydro-2,3-dihydroxybenzoate dehydrogenase [Hoyosella altamirensis]
MTELTLVTGAGSGIGRATALTLAKAGRTVVLTDVDEAALHETSHLIGGQPAYVLDVRDTAEVERVISTIEVGHGPITHLAHVAGVLVTGSILDTGPAAWQQVFDVNVHGTVNVLRTAGAIMRKRQHGAIVVVGSNAAGVPRAGMGAYGASKAAVSMIVRVLGLELAPFGIRANVVAPGSTDTAMQRSLWRDEETGLRTVLSGDPDSFKVGIPLGRIAEPSDIADAVDFLLSERARHITMQTLYVDGGATLRA